MRRVQPSRWAASWSAARPDHRIMKAKRRSERAAVFLARNTAPRPGTLPAAPQRTNPAPAKYPAPAAPDPMASAPASRRPRFAEPCQRKWRCRRPVQHSEVGRRHHPRRQRTTAKVTRPLPVAKASFPARPPRIAGGAKLTRNALEENRNATTSCPVAGRTGAFVLYSNPSSRARRTRRRNTSIGNVGKKRSRAAVQQCRRQLTPLRKGPVIVADLTQTFIPSRQICQGGPGV